MANIKLKLLKLVNTPGTDVKTIKKLTISYLVFNLISIY